MMCPDMIHESTPLTSIGLASYSATYPLQVAICLARGPVEKMEAGALFGNCSALACFVMWSWRARYYETEAILTQATHNRPAARVPKKLSKRHQGPEQVKATKHTCTATSRLFPPSRWL